MQSQLTNLLLAFQLIELKPLLENAFINKVQFLGNDFFKFKLNTGKGTKDFIVFPKGIYLTNYKLEALKQSQLVAELNKKLSNERISSARQVNFDRVLEIETQHYFLVFEFFADFNIILTDKERITVSCLRKEEWKDRVIQRKKQYSFPAARGINPLDLSFDEFMKQLSSEKALIRQLASFINLAPVFLEEAIYLAGIEKTLHSNNLAEEKARKLFNELKALAEADEKKLKPLTIESDSETYFLPFKLSHLKGIEKAFPSINEALDGFFSESLKRVSLEPEKNVLNEKLGKLKASFEEQLAAKKSLEEKSIAFRQQAEFIYANFPELQELAGIAAKALESKKSKEEILELLLERKNNKLASKAKEIDLKKKSMIIEA